MSNWLAVFICVLILVGFFVYNFRSWLWPLLHDDVFPALKRLRGHLFQSYTAIDRLDMLDLTKTPLPPRQGIIADEWGQLAETHQYQRHWWGIINGLRFTAYSYIGVPALIASYGALGFYTFAYSILGNVFMIIMMPSLRARMNRNQAITVADLVHERFQSSFLAEAVALTTIIATLAYLALQIYAVDLLLRVLGLGKDPEVLLIILFLLVSLIAYAQGLQFLKQMLLLKSVFLIIAAIIVFLGIWQGIGGTAKIFHEAFSAHPQLLTLAPEQRLGFLTLSFSSAIALWLYPHNQLGVFMARDADVVRRETVATTLFSFIVAILFALLGIAALATTTPFSHLYKGLYESNVILPELVVTYLHPVLIGFVFSIFIIGALLSAVGMAIASGNLFAQNVYSYHFMKSTIRREKHDLRFQGWSTWSTYERFMAARIFSLVMKVGALAFVLVSIELRFMQVLVNFQLLGSIIILQILPAVFEFQRGVLKRIPVLLGWSVGMLTSIILTIPTFQPGNLVGNLHVPGTLFPIWGAFDIYTGLVGLCINVLIAYIGSWIATSVDRQEQCIHIAARAQVEMLLASKQKEEQDILAAYRLFDMQPTVNVRHIRYAYRQKIRTTSAASTYKDRYVLHAAYQRLICFLMN